MMNFLVGPIANMVTDAVKGFVETKKAKADLALTEIKAQKSLKEQQIAGKISWEATAVDQMKGANFDMPVGSSGGSLHTRMDTTYKSRF